MQTSFFLAHSTGTEFINSDTLLRIEASSNYSKLFFNNGKTLVVAKALKWFDDKLNKNGFIRIHRSHLVNAQQVHILHPTFVELRNKEQLQVSRRKKTQTSNYFAVIAACLLLLFSLNSFAQSFSINTTGLPANNTAMLDVSSSTKGMLIPRMTLAQRNAIATPAQGLMIYQTDNIPGFYYYEGGWNHVSNGPFYKKQGTIYNTNWNATAPDSLFIFGSDSINNKAGTADDNRMFFYKPKRAFRAGIANNANWDLDSLGFNSFATGFNTKATGSASTAMGLNSIAVGNYSVAMGNSSAAFGDYSVAMGQIAEASGNVATAMGINTIASGVGSTTMGSTTIASGTNATAMGSSSKASGGISIAMGSSTIASGDYSTAMGYNTKASGLVSTATGVGTTASGENSTTMGNSTKATGSSSTAMGYVTTASGAISTAMGINTTARAYGSVTLGANNDSIATSNLTTWVATDPVLIIGNGASDVARSNALVVYKNGNMDVSGYTQLGVGAAFPAIKVKELSVNSAATQGGLSLVAHGVTASKIVAVSALLTISTFQIMPNHSQAGYQYWCNVDGGNIAITTVSGNSASILNMPIKILVTYKE